MRSVPDGNRGERTGQHRRDREASVFKRQIADLEARIAERETLVKELEAAMAAPGFYDNRQAAEPVVTRHAALMWEVGDLLQQWEDLHLRADASGSSV